MLFKCFVYTNSGTPAIFAIFSTEGKKWKNPILDQISNLIAESCTNFWSILGVPTFNYTY